jgi:hypothetical protein
VPVVDDFDAATGVYSAHYSACTPACAKAFLVSQRSVDREVRLVWQRQLMVEHFGWPPDAPVPQARAWEELAVCGGHLDVEEWRRTAGAVRSAVRPVEVVPHRVLIEMASTEAEEALHREAMLLTGGNVVEEEDEDGDAVVVDATGHGGVGADALNGMFTTGLRRPPEAECIKTVDQLLKAYPDCPDLVSNDPGEFERFLSAGDLPSDAKCKELKVARDQEKKRQRKRKAPTTKTPTEEIPTPTAPPSEKKSKPASSAKRTTRGGGRSQ